MIRLQRWREFQHYKHKSVPWVKLYAALLDDHEYRALPLEARAVLLDLWMLGSRSLDGILTVSRQSLAWRLRIDESVLASALQAIAAQHDEDGNPKWILCDSRECLDSVYTESRLEREKRESREERENRLSPAARSNQKPDEKAPGWVAEAHALYAKHIGILPFGRLGKALKPVVAKWGWGDIRGGAVHQWWDIYCRHRPTQRANGTWPNALDGEEVVKNTRFCSPEDFVKTLQTWRDLAQPVAS